MKTKTSQITVKMSRAERNMLNHLAMAERVSKAFIMRRLIRDAAGELYRTIDESQSRPWGER